MIVCDKCNRKLCWAADGSKPEKVVKFYVVCPCGHTISNTFLGYPKLAGTDEYSFEFVDEFKIVCKPRK